MRWVLVVAVLVMSSIAAAAPDDPSAIVVVLDRSAAMKGQRFDLARDAIADLVESLAKTDKVAVIAYGKRPVIVAPMSAPSRSRVAKALAELSTDGREAELAPALAAAKQMFKADKLGLVHHVVLVSAHDATREDASAAYDLARDGVTLSTIAVQTDSQQLEQIARAGDGRAYIANDLIDLHRFALAAAHVPAPPPHDAAVVVLIDRSESMRGAMLDAAKEYARVVVEVLAPNDVVSVVAFDTTATVIAHPQRAGNRMRISSEIARIETKGMTSYAPALGEALVELAGVTAANKHVVLLTDGSDDNADLAKLLADYDKAHVELTVVGLDRLHLDRVTEIAQRGHGTLLTPDDNLGALARVFMVSACRGRGCNFAVVR